MVVLHVPSALTKYVVEVVGEMVMVDPLPSRFPPHEPEYHTQFAPLPRLPEPTDNIDEFPEQMVAGLTLAVTEAVENAIYHGNKNDKAKKIFLKFDVSPDGFSFKIKDQGKGFNIDAVPDPTDDNADFSETEGRGLFIIKSLADEVLFHDNGSCIELVFKIASITKQMSDERINTFMKKIKSPQNTKKHNDI